MSNHPVDAHVGKRLRLRRNMLGLSQEALGTQIGVTFQQVQKYELGTNRIGAGRLYDFSKILNVDVSFFYEGFADAAKAAGFAEDNDNSFQPEAIDSKETLALVRAFSKIKSQTVRKKVISLVKAMNAEETEAENA